MKNKTAVEWLLSQLNNLGFDYQLNSVKVVIEQAIELEREQIIDAYDSGTFYLEGEDYFKKLYQDESGI